MLPSFPDFKNLQLNDRPHVEAFTRKHRPYSDFNFTNLWTWDFEGTRKVCELNGNLAILFTDYRTAEPSLSFLGDNKAGETSLALLNFAKDNGINPILKFIPEETALQVNHSELTVTEDPHNFDYIFSTSDIAYPLHKKLKSKRQLAHRFITDNPQAKFESRDLADTSIHSHILDMLYRWEQNKLLQNKVCELAYEEIAIQRLLSTAKDHSLILSCAFLDNKMIAFSIDELLPGNFALSHFIKGDINYRGIYEYVNQQVADLLLEHNRDHWNWEQDLNLDGLRKLKESYRPAYFLKKYTISN